jgi:dTDP-4-dehydrorhamnose reductase
MQLQTDEFPTKTKRPKNSILNNAKIKQTFNLECKSLANRVGESDS